MAYKRKTYDCGVCKDIEYTYVKWRDSLTALDRAIISLQEVKCNDLYTWDGKYSREYAERAIAVVDFFKKYGFSITDDMQQLLDGTDESYVKE